jgi:hypothetical protein
VVPAVLERLAAYSNPAAQHRLMRLRGRRGPSLDALRATPRWLAAVAAVASLSEPPALELEA